MEATLTDTLELLSEQARLSKDLGMLIEGKGSLINCYNHITHRIHGKADTLGTTSSRMTHRQPNLTQLGRTQDFRKLLCVPEGKVFVDVDADALELVMLGHYLGPYDNYEFAKIIDNGKKENSTDIHTVNQHRVGLPTRDLAKTFIYSVCYSAGATKIGLQIWNGEDFDYTQTEYNKAKAQVEARLIDIDGKLYYPVAKGTIEAYTDRMIFASIYGNRAIDMFRNNTKGYNELLYDAQNKMVKTIKDTNYIEAIDGRLLYLRAKHKALNLLLQSAGAIFMKYYLVTVDNKLQASSLRLNKDYSYILNVHDAISLEIIPEVQPTIDKILIDSFKEASDMLGLKYQVKGKPSYGKNQWETH